MISTASELGVNRGGMPATALRVRPVIELDWESTDQLAAGDPAIYVLPQQFGDRRDGRRASACFLDRNGPGERQIVDG